jgi:hypothetical protein
MPYAIRLTSCTVTVGNIGYDGHGDGLSRAGRRCRRANELMTIYFFRSRCRDFWCLCFGLGLGLGLGLGWSQVTQSWTDGSRHMTWFLIGVAPL